MDDGPALDDGFLEREGIVRATVAYRERIAMPPAAVLTVTLIDVSRADAAADVVASRVVTDPGNVPVEIDLQYDAGRIDARSTYSVRATIEVDGTLWWTSTDAHHVLTRGAPDHVDIWLSRLAR